MKYQKHLLEQFPAQINHAISHYAAHGIRLDEISNILICGLGGSGIAGQMAKRWFTPYTPVPIEVCSDYFLPKYVNEKTLVILSSYSGNTEETLSMAEEALARGAAMIALTTGGTLGAFAQKNQIPFYLAETGFHPRMALGYSLTNLVLIFEELLGRAFHKQLKEASAALRNFEGFIENAKGIEAAFDGMENRRTIIFADFYTFPIGVRFCQQLQENAKIEAYVHELPESNHNVIETIYGKLDANYIFLNSHHHSRVDLRFDYLKELLLDNGNQVFDMDLKNQQLPVLLSAIYTLDWLSLIIADLREKQSDVVGNIDKLKAFLNKKAEKKSSIM